MAIIEHGQCRIKYLNKKGLGVASTRLGEVELPYVLPGELVEFEKHKYRGITNSILKRIIEPSLSRIVPPCPYFGACGGCLLQHLNEFIYTEFKTNLLKNALAKHHIQTNINPLVTIPSGRRRRASFEAVKKQSQIYFGFHRFHSHQIINIDKCPILNLPLSNLIEPLKSILNVILQPHQKVQIFVTKAYNGIDILFESKEQLLLQEKSENLLKSFAEANNVVRIIFQRSFQDAITLLEIEKPYIILGEVPVEIDAKGFLQSSDMSDEVLSKLVLKYLPLNTEGLKIVDLFCGRGTFTLHLRKYGKVDGFEFDKIALNSLKNAVNENQHQIELFEQDLFNLPLNSSKLNKYGLCIINPPRLGAAAQCLELSRSTINRIVYVSCNPETFASDAKILLSSGYKLIEVTPVDQFYWSPHLEIVGFFERSK